MNQSTLSDFDTQINEVVSLFREKILIDKELTRETLFAEIVKLIKNQLSNGIFKFSIKLCDPLISNGQNFQIYIYSAFPEFYFNLFWHNKPKYNGLLKASLEFRPRN